MAPVHMHHFILLVAWVALGGCWPMSDAEFKLDLITARNSQAVGSPTTNGSTVTIQTVTLAKEINTALAILMVLLTIGTYWLLISYTPTLSNEIILPSKLLEDNIAAVLSLTWPKHHNVPLYKIEEGYPYDWVLFCKKETGQFGPSPDARPFHQILGFDDFRDDVTILRRQSHMVNVKAFSPIMKSLVQIAIWNYVSLWLVLVMIVNTLVYNGFLSHGITNDGVIRLFLVGVYAVASIGHRYRTMTLLYRNFTSVLFQACWTIICKEFVFGDRCAYRLGMIQGSSDMVWTSFDFELFGTMEHADTYYNLTDNDDRIGSYDGIIFSEWSVNDKRRRSHLIARDKVESKVDKFVKPIREAEIKAYEKATESALEKALANVAVLLAICLATALAPWNSIQTTSATSAQLGSYALLLSISTGFLALISSMTQLTNATESARTLLLLQENTIAAHSVYNESEDVSNKFWLRDEPTFSFSKHVEEKSQFTSSSLWRSMSFLDKLPCLLLGPALMLIPRMHGDRQSHPNYGSEIMTLKVQGVQFACRTFKFVFSRIDCLVPVSPDEGTRQQRKNIHVNAKRARENRNAGGRNENDNIVEHQQESPGTSGKFDASNAHE